MEDNIKKKFSNILFLDISTKIVPSVWPTKLVTLPVIQLSAFLVTLAVVVGMYDVA